MTHDASYGGVWRYRNADWMFNPMPIGFDTAAISITADPEHPDHWVVINASGQQIETEDAGLTWALVTETG